MESGGARLEPRLQIPAVACIEEDHSSYADLVHKGEFQLYVGVSIQVATDVRPVGDRHAVGIERSVEGKPRTDSAHPVATYVENPSEEGPIENRDPLWVGGGDQSKLVVHFEDKSRAWRSGSSPEQSIKPTAQSVAQKLQFAA